MKNFYKVFMKHYRKTLSYENGGLSLSNLMNSISPTPATLLNLDFELESQFDLSPLAGHLEGKVFILYNGKTDHGYRLDLEPVINGRLNDDPQACTDHFITLINALPKELMDLWSSCTMRLFDYGFDGGLETPPFRAIISTASLSQIAQLGADIQITVYPFRE